jgi:hypothetical protein
LRTTEPSVNEIPILEDTDTGPAIESVVPHAPNIAVTEAHNINDGDVKIGDRTPTAPPMTHAASAPSQNLQSSSGLVGELAAVLARPRLKPLTAQKPKPPPLKEEAVLATLAEYEKSVKKGRELLSGLDTVLRKSSAPGAASAEVGRSKDDFKALYKTSMTPAPEKGYRDVRSDRIGSDYQGQYHNKISETGTEIHAETNRKDYDKGPGGDAFSNSDILFHHYTAAAPGSKALRTVRRANVANKETRSLMLYIRARAQAQTTTAADEKLDLHALEAGPPLEFAPDSEEAAALLGSPNGSAVVHMLRDHASALGSKTIQNVRIEGNSLVLTLQEFKS